MASFESLQEVIQRQTVSGVFGVDGAADNALPLQYEYYNGTDFGFRTEAERDAKRAEWDARVERDREDRITKTILSLVGKRLAPADWDSFKTEASNRKALELAKGWVESPIRNLIIAGPIGSGKTYLMACVCHALVMAGAREVSDLGRTRADRCCGFENVTSLAWMSAPEWIAQVKRGFKDEDEAYRADRALKDAIWTDILLLDDLGKVHPGANGVSWLEEQFYALIDARYRAERFTVVTTEWTREALNERVGASVVSRLMDGAVIAGLSEYEWRKPAPTPS